MLFASNPTYSLSVQQWRWLELLNGSMLLEKNLPSKVLHIVSIGWKPPWEDRFKLNIDGVSKASPNRAGRCGIIRDSLGRWVAGFMRNTGTTSALEAELWALRDGLMLTADLHLLKIHVEADA
ncbi:putative ribonuclease H protein [Camellia lanceoleosa]|uniref:Ribonuclease H protein n=1 Tax=Camellia lanceoleosa TaxID=1840588 RepID=A0ACC0GUT8_9ERIC|nr:putative ribonuclease H protein [Camellia lanceoleosa]